MVLYANDRREMYPAAPLSCLVSLVLVSLVQAAPVTVTVGIIMRYGLDVGRPNSGWMYENVASAITLAIEDYQANRGLQDVKFRFVQKKLLANCSPKQAVARLSDLVFTEKPDVAFGMSCSKVMIPVDRYTSYWKIVHFPQGGTSPILSDKNVYTTLVRIHPSGDKMAKAYTNIFQEYGWRRAAMVMSYGYCELPAQAIYSALKNMKVTITEYIQPVSTAIEDWVLEKYLDGIRERTRVIIFCLGDKRSQMNFLRIAHRKGMRAPDFVFIGNNNVPEERVFRPWTSLGDLTPQQVEEWKNILVEINLKQVSISDLKGQKYEDFYDRVPIRLSQPPWNYNVSLERGWRGSFKAADIYDVTTAYMDALNETLAEGGDYHNGEIIMNKIRNRVVHGLRGKFLFDGNADREPDYWLYDLRAGWDSFQEVILLSVAEPPGKRFVPIDGGFLYWGTEGNKPPPDTPACGFQGELCPQDTTGQNIIIGASVSAGVLLMVVGLVVFTYRRQKAMEAMEQDVWKIVFSDITLGKKRTGSVVNMSQRSMHSEASELSANQGTRQLFTEVGTYHDNLVAVLRVDKPRMVLTKTDLKELKAMKDMAHDNLALFVGACVEAPNICYIMQYYTKGSLQDIIENEIIGLDWMFKTSLLSDLAKGMAYLHRSMLGSHGGLRSSRCLVDSRWQLKVASYGLHAFTTDNAPSTTDPQLYRKLLWTAPELLRMPRPEWPRYGTQKADIYSFGVIAQEVIYRVSPYFIETESPKEIIRQLARQDIKPFRPQLPKLDPDIPSRAVQLVELAWAEDPAERPTFERLIKLIRNINNNQEVDIMSTLIEKLEKYANNLEDIVNQRTSELVVEKKKTDALLYRMLPESVAEHLKHGRTVEAELFSEVTVYFSDIVGFTALSLESTPLQVVTLLNDLYSMFDDIIDLHDVYKVETIGDSYMVVSGLPRRNGNQHVGEIATLALDLMSAACDFRIQHRPGLGLQLRIGLHTGPCAAGVVGLSMPRYCLFGDTVNMASRMETNGKALRIHMSKYAFAALEKLEGYHVIPRGEMQIKGKGLQMTYWLTGKDGYNKRLPNLKE